MGTDGGGAAGPEQAPYPEDPKSWFGRDRDIIQIHGDIVEPPGVEWEAETNPGRVLAP